MKQWIPLYMLTFVLMGCEIDDVVRTVDPRDRFIGQYEVDEYSLTYDIQAFYRIDISALGRHGNEVLIDNFYGLDVAIQANASGSKVIIPFQVVGGYEIDGVGVINGNEINFSYNIHEQNCCRTTFVDELEAVAWR